MINQLYKLSLLFGSQHASSCYSATLAKTQQRQQQQEQLQHFDMHANPHYEHATDVAELSRLCRTQHTERDYTAFLQPRGTLELKMCS
jgi:hypothetical protein